MRDIDPSKPPHVLYIDEGFMDPIEETKYEGKVVSPKSAYRDRMMLLAEKEVIRLKMTDFHAEATLHMKEHADIALIIASINIAVADGGDLLLNAREHLPYTPIALIYSHNQYARQDKYVKRDIGWPIPFWSHNIPTPSLDERITTKYADWIMNRSLFGTHCQYIIQRAFNVFIDRYYDLVEREALAVEAQEAQAAKGLATALALADEDSTTMEDDTLETAALAAAQEDGSNSLTLDSQNVRLQSNYGPAPKIRRPQKNTGEIFDFAGELRALGLPNARIDTPVPLDAFRSR